MLEELLGGARHLSMPCTARYGVGISPIAARLSGARGLFGAGVDGTSRGTGARYLCYRWTISPRLARAVIRAVQTDEFTGACSASAPNAAAERSIWSLLEPRRASDCKLAVPAALSSHRRCRCSRFDRSSVGRLRRARRRYGGRERNAGGAAARSPLHPSRPRACRMNVRNSAKSLHPSLKSVVPASIVNRSAHTISRPSGRHNTRSCNSRSRPKCSVRSMRSGFVPRRRASSMAS
jgi:hypothetical protein